MRARMDVPMRASSSRTGEVVKNTKVYGVALSRTANHADLPPRYPTHLRALSRLRTVAGLRRYLDRHFPVTGSLETQVAALEARVWLRVENLRGLGVADPVREARRLMESQS